MKVADLFVRCLETEGVRYVFGVPGEETEELLFALAKSPITFVPVRHEQGAAFMANLWGRLTGKAGVCLSTLGPGATNLVTGVADANLDKAPVVAITAQGGRGRLHHESHQYLNIEDMFRPITKWNSAVHTPETVTEIVRKAFKTAEFEKPGATHIELSEDVASAQVPPDMMPITPRIVRRPSPDHKAVSKTLQLLQEAKRPLVIAGNGAVRKLASKQLTLFAAGHMIPVVSTFMGKGAISDRMGESLFSIGLSFRDYVQEAVDNADLILTIGYDIAEYAPEKWNRRPERRIVHIDFLPAEVYRQYDPEVEIVGDISATLWELNRQSPPYFDRDWYKPVRERIISDIAAYNLEHGDRLTIPGTINILRAVLPFDGLLISDVGTHKMWIARNYPTYCHNGCIISNGLATMGIALPGAVAASLARPDRPIIAAMGDGGFMMNVQELETAKRLGARFTAVVFNDFDYGLISWKQEMHRGESVYTRLENPDFPALAASFGIKAYRPETPEELRAVLKQAVGTRELSLVEVRVSTHVNHELVQKLKAYYGEHHAAGSQPN